MLCVFSKNLIELWRLSRLEKKGQSEYSIIEVVKNLPKSDLPYLLCDPYIKDDVVNDSILYKHCTNKHLRKLTNWVTENILCKMLTDNINTTSVKLRIFTSMLNKLVFEEHITIEDSSYIHYNVVNNVWKLRCDINSAELPF